MNTLVLMLVNGSWNFEKNFVKAKKGIVTIGSESTNKIVLNDKEVSKKHCLIFKKKDDWLISDLNSKNKTFVLFPDGTKKRATNKIPITLEKGCQIIIGETILKVI